MFADIEADCYILVDGDDTYDPSVAPNVIAIVTREGCDFVNVARVSTSAEAYRRGHLIGNLVLTRMVRWFFGRESSDMLSGLQRHVATFRQILPRHVRRLPKPKRS